MKKETHPKYQKVLFIDSASGYKFVCGSTMHPEGKEKFEGVEYPVYYLSISSSSHPFFTGSKGLVDAEGRVEKFRKRFERKAATDQEASKDQPEGENKGSTEKKSVAGKKPANKMVATDKKKVG